MFAVIVPSYVANKFDGIPNLPGADFRIARIIEGADVTAYFYIGVPPAQGVVWRLFRTTECAVEEVTDCYINLPRRGRR